MTPIGWMAIGLAVVIGLGLGSFLCKRFPNLFGADKKIQKVIKDPHLLVEKLKAHGKFYSDGKEFDIQVGIDKETGKEIVVVEEIKSKKAGEIKKKVEKEAKKKVKKKKIAFTGKDPGKRKKGVKK